jgi:hypothetical protein
MFTLEFALGVLVGVCLVGIAAKLVLRRKLDEIDGMHEVHSHHPEIDSIGM